MNIKKKNFIFFKKSTRTPRQSRIKWKIYPTILDYLTGIIFRKRFVLRIETAWDSMDRAITQTHD